MQVNPFQSGLKIVDCGDIPVTPYDNKYAIKQIEDGHKALLHRTAFSALGNDSGSGNPLTPLTLDGKNHPRIITLGGDHTIVLPILRSIYSVYGPISVIHFDRCVIQYCVMKALNLIKQYIVILTHGCHPSLAVLLLNKQPSITVPTSIGPVKRD